MDQGKIIEQGVPQDLLAQHFAGVMVTLPIGVGEKLANSGFEYQQNNNRVEILTAEVEIIVRRLLEEKIALEGMQIRSPNLEDLFIKLTGHQLRG